MSNRPGLVWDQGSLVWDDNSLVWENAAELPTRIGNVLMVKKSRARILKVKSSRYRRRTDT